MRSPNFQSNPNAHYNTELSPTGRDDMNIGAMLYNSENSEDDPNLTMVQTEQMDLVPRETYTAGMLSPGGL